MKNKTVLITGAAGGIGTYLCSYFAETAGAVILVDINEQALTDAKKRLSKYPAKLVSYTVDQGDKKAVDKMAVDVLKKFGCPDILVNNAGIGFHGELENTSLEKWHQLMNVNFWGTLHFVYAFLPSMKERQSGHIVNVATGQVFYKMPTWGAYTVSKSALAAFSDILRAELGKDHIHVTTVYPYMVNTGFYKDVAGETLMGKLSMSLLPLYAQSPGAVAKIIYEAVLQEKPVEMVSPLNTIGKYMRLLPGASRVFDSMMVSGLSKKGRKPLRESAPVKTITKATDAAIKAIEGIVPPKGFRIEEVMSGEHEFMPGFGTAGKQPMEFTVSWGPSNIIEWLNPVSDQFFRNELQGTVSIGGLCELAPCTGYLELRYLRRQQIKYFFTFEANGKTYEYSGVKPQIYPWNLPYSHTTCLGELREAGKKEIVSRSVTHFHWDTMQQFLKSLHLTSPASR
jgi:short-subunit dehydrogenase